MPTALVIQHVPGEKVGWLGEWLPARGVDLRVVAAWTGEPIPADPGPDALIVLGGPMGAYDDHDAPWLPPTKYLLASAVDRELPTLGICLGAQLLAVAVGGRVEKGAAGPELGLGRVDVPAPGDQLFRPGPIDVVQWHWDSVVDLPAGADLLASSAAYDVQAFRVGPVAWGLQFHAEATLPMVADWARNDGEALRAAGLDPVEVVGEVAAAEPAARPAWQALVDRFADIVVGT